MKKKNIFLAVLAVALILFGSAGSAWAYFTTYVEARGTLEIALEDETTVEEDFSDWTKHVVIASDADSEPVYVRARAYCGSQYELVYTSADNKWAPNSDGYYYYSDILSGGQKTSELLVRIENVPKDVTDVSEFNVAVIYETTPVLYDENGDPYADWNGKLDVTVEEGGNK